MTENKLDMLLMCLPFWTPLCPPQGISRLKAYLNKNDFNVHTEDANVENAFKKTYVQYFDLLRKIVPQENLGNLYDVGHDLLRNHMMAFMGCSKDSDYNSIIQRLLYENYLYNANDQQINELDAIISEYYQALDEYIVEVLEKYHPPILGLSTTPGSLPSAIYVSKISKQKYPNIKILMGGNVFIAELHTSSEDFKSFLETTKDYIDHILIGEGEIILCEYLKGNLAIDQRVYTQSDIKYKEIQINDNVFPDMSDLDIKKYPYSASYGSISCPFKCSFCTEKEYFGEYCQRNVVLTADEIEKIYHSHGKKLFFMLDTLMNYTLSDISMELIKRNISIYMDGYLRIEESLCEIEKIQLWKKGGLYRVRIGVESGSQKMLERMGKDITISQIKTSIRTLAEVGIKTTAYFVVGHPGETEEDIEKTMRLIEELKDDLWQAEFHLFRYYYYGQIKSDEWSSKRKLVYPKEYRKFMLIQKWTVDLEPTRKQAIERVHRLANFCGELGVPNPYTLSEINDADNRWKRLHSSAVPSFMEIQKQEAILNRFLKNDVATNVIG